jgi:hypothetical protein
MPELLPTGQSAEIVKVLRAAPFSAKAKTPEQQLRRFQDVL